MALMRPSAVCAVGAGHKPRETQSGAVRTALCGPRFRREYSTEGMDIVDFWILAAVVIAAYAVAVVAALWVVRRCEDGTADKGAEAARAAFRKWFKFAN